MTSSDRETAVPERKLSILPPMMSRQSRPSIIHRQDSGGGESLNYNNSNSRRMSVSPSRRMSMWMRRPSVAGSYRLGLFKEPVVKVQYENTYRLAPADNERFHASKVEPIIEEVMRSYLDGESYDARKCAQMSLRLSDLIKDHIKGDLKLTRYKLVCTVVIGESSGQSVRCASRCIWNQETDGFASASFKNNSLFATATVFAVYFE